MSRVEKRQRAVDESVRLEKTRKRRKVQRKPKESRSDSKATSREVAIIDGDHLRWKEVALPDRLEDAEGFFGLEEIENVQVVRDEGTKQIRFRVSSLCIPENVDTTHDSLLPTDLHTKLSRSKKLWEPSGYKHRRCSK